MAGGDSYVQTVLALRLRYLSKRHEQNEVFDRTCGFGHIQGDAIRQGLRFGNRIQVE